MRFATVPFLVLALSSAAFAQQDASSTKADYSGAFLVDTKTGKWATAAVVQIPLTPRFLAMPWNRGDRDKLLYRSKQKVTTASGVEYYPTLFDPTFNGINAQLVAFIGGALAPDSTQTTTDADGNTSTSTQSNDFAAFGAGVRFNLFPQERLSLTVGGMVNFSNSKPHGALFFSFGLKVG